MKSVKEKLNAKILSDKEKLHTEIQSINDYTQQLTLEQDKMLITLQKTGFINEERWAFITSQISKNSDNIMAIIYKYYNQN